MLAVATSSASILPASTTAAENADSGTQSTNATVESSGESETETVEITVKLK